MSSKTAAVAADAPEGPSDVTSEERYLTPNEAAVQMGISYAQVYRYIKAGQLPAFTIRGQLRVKEADVAEMLKPKPYVPEATAKLETSSLYGKFPTKKAKKPKAAKLSTQRKKRRKVS